MITEKINFPTLWRADAEWMLENRKSTTEDGTVLTYADLLRNIIALFDLLSESPNIPSVTPDPARPPGASS